MFKWFKSLFSYSAPTIDSRWHIKGTNPWKKKYYVVKKVDDGWVQLSCFRLNGSHDGEYECEFSLFYKVFSPYKTNPITKKS